MIEPLRNRPLLGAGLMLIAMFILGYIDNFMRLIAEDGGLWQFHLMRSVVVCSVILVLARLFKWRLWPQNWRGYAIRCFLYSLALVLYFGALGVLSVAQAGAGMFSAPTFVLIISALFLKTPIGIWRIAAVALGFTGVLVILRPDFSDLSVLTFIPMLAGLCYALANISTRRLCEGESTATLVMGSFAALGLWGVLGLIFFTLFPVDAGQTGRLAFLTGGWVVPSGQFIFWMLVQAFGSLLAVVFLTRAYQVAEVSYVTVMEYSFLIFAAFWAWVVWGIVVDFQGVAGILAIILSGVIIAIRAR